MKPTAVGIGTSWGAIGIGGLGQSNIVPYGKGNGGGTPTINQGGGGGGGGGGRNVPCPSGCGCHPFWYFGTSLGAVLLLTVLLARL